MGRRKRQTHLTFEPLAASGSDADSNHNGQAQPSPPRIFAPANVRYSQHAVRVRSHPRLLVRDSSEAGKGKKKERRLEQSRIRTAAGPKPARATFTPQPLAGSKRTRAVASDSSDESAVDMVPTRTGSDDVSEDELPASRVPVGSQHKPQVLDDSDSDDVPLPTSSSKMPRSSQSVATRLGKATLLVPEDENEDEDDEDPILPPSSAMRRRRPPRVDLDESDDEVVSPAKRRRMQQLTPQRAAADSEDESSPKRSKGRLLRTPQLSSPTKRERHKGHRTEKQKKMELLRRRRAGEKISQLTDSESEVDDDARRGMYDTDSDDGLQVLKEFDDDEEEEEVEEIEQPSSRSRKKSKKNTPPRSQKARESEGSEDLDDFVVEDDDAPLGVPIAIPLQFTRQAHLPLKDQFPFVVEWLVHNKIDPKFKRRDDELFTNAWRKLNDEYQGLANSKFASSAWKTEFYRTLKSRPTMDSYEVGTDGAFNNNCEACGRSGHPATWRIIFQGSAYNKSTLEDIESDSDDDDDDDDDSSSDSNGDDDADKRSVDSQGMPLQPTGREWHVGAVCNSNAETTHDLLHWKHHLKERVEQELEDEGWNKPAKLKERELMKSKKRRRLVEQIVRDWTDSKFIDKLYAKFKHRLELAQNKSTTGSRGGGRGWR
ncbi:hypothetical protein Micbo1qcDRAFT_230260 [Microdochium bolleyi]|uniref:DUF4211 domain-containing protein n=1 Tax=Microdochium bolleyi TaxID=196109 RepID=A0A136JKK7_9PEZI|nr:hypothetical protein Micbo1qcDRAFT_230260 [Microdochium bolleyi]